MLLFSRILACEFFREQSRLHQIGNAQAGSRGFVAVGGTNAALGRADFRLAFAQLALFIERAMIRQDQVRAIADQQVLADLDSQLSQTIDLRDQRDRDR